MEDEENLFEDELSWFGEVSRFDVSCGFYGDNQWQNYCDDGVYIEFEDHEKIINIYKKEISRLRALI